MSAGTNKWPLGFEVVSGTDAVVINFKSILPLADAVIDEILFPANVGSVNTAYTGDASIATQTLKAGTEYPIHGTSIQLTSGGPVLVERA